LPYANATALSGQFESGLVLKVFLFNKKGTKAVILPCSFLFLLKIPINWQV